MTFDLQTALPQLIPEAIAWAEAQSAFIAKVGEPLNATLTAVAISVGVAHPERIRIAEVEYLPLPEQPTLRQAALATGLLDRDTIGLTLDHGILICRGHGTIRLLSHEFRHVYQYEQAGGIAAFLPVYLQQIVTYGYSEAPFEVDARAHERDG